MPKFEEAKESLLRVASSLLTMVQANMVTSYLTLFEDLVTLVDDCLLLLRMVLISTKSGEPPVLTANTKLKFFTRTTAILMAATAQQPGGVEEEKTTTTATSTSATTQGPSTIKGLQGPPNLDIPSLHSLLLILTSTTEVMIQMLGTTSHFLASSPSFLSLTFHLCEQVELSSHPGFQSYTSTVPAPLLDHYQGIAVEALSAILGRLSNPPNNVKLAVIATILRYARQQVKSLSPCKVSLALILWVWLGVPYCSACCSWQH